VTDRTDRIGRFLNPIGWFFATVVDVARQIRYQVDEEILDRAAGLFAQHGFEHTSLKDLADAVGLSKAGLLHHYPSKEALFNAAVDMGRRLSRQVFEQATRVPAGPDRDRRAVALLTDAALDRPGLIALASRTVTSLGAEDEDAVAPQEDEDLLVFEIFGIGPAECDTERLVRVIGMLSAMAVLSLAANHLGDKTAWRPHIVSTCLDALGHRGPSHSSSDSAQVEV
jgi:AcrR family transcriptional regulator